MDVSPPIQAQPLLPGLPDCLALSGILARVPCTAYASLSAVCRTWRSAVKSEALFQARMQHPEYQQGLPVVIHRAVGSSFTPDDLRVCISVFDSSTALWRQLPPIDFLPEGAPMFASCTFVDGVLYVIGGMTGSIWDIRNDVYSLAIKTGESKWKRCASMIDCRANFACVTKQGKIYVAGGNGDDILTMATTEVYDIETDSWQELPKLVVSRSRCAGAVFQNELYVIGGYTSKARVWDGGEEETEMEEESVMWVPSVEVLDEGNRRWRMVDSAASLLQLFKVTYATPTAL